MHLKGNCSNCWKWIVNEGCLRLLNDQFQIVLYIFNDGIQIYFFTVLNFIKAGEVQQVFQESVHTVSRLAHLLKLFLRKRLRL